MAFLSIHIKSNCALFGKLSVFLRNNKWFWLAAIKEIELKIKVDWNIDNLNLLELKVESLKVKVQVQVHQN